MIKRTDILEENATEEQKEAAEEARLAQEKFEALEAKAHASDLARAKAEGELEATRKMGASVKPEQTAQWGDAEWKHAEEQMGMSKHQIIASGQLATQVFDQKSKALFDKIAAAEERAKNAEEKFERLNSRSDSERYEKDFYEKKPALSAYKKEVSEFLADVPESDRNDAKKMDKWLSKAETYVKGLVGGKMERKNSASSLGLRGGYEEDEVPEDQKIDFSGLESRGEKQLVADIWEETNSKLVADGDKEISGKDFLKKYSSSDGLGVRFDSESEFKRGDKLLSNGNGRFGGERGTK